MSAALPPTLFVASALLAASAVGAEPPPGQRNFVACPIVRDTQTVPCWLAEYDGELYYLGIQTDVSAEFHPPLLGHRVLVEGVMKDGPRICGGVVLEPVKVSPLPELDGTCNTILPAEDRYTVPFAPRPPGPSGGRLAFETPQAPAGAPPPREALTGTQEFTVQYDFAMLIVGRHSAVLTRILDYAMTSKARQVSITGYRGATLLSDGSVLVEDEGLAEKRAREIARLLTRAGLPAASLSVNWSTELAPADGVDDWRERRALVRVEP
jgi:outer membrane protein OmpA-like peptidoglycan-associated protein